jgi:hypothetical protein
VLLAIVILALIGFVLLVVGAPLRGAMRGLGGDGEPQEKSDSTAGSIEQDDLEAAREVKYREIRDVELDFRTGKLSGEDYEAIDSQLRAEALEILDRLKVKPRDA